MNIDQQKNTEEAIDSLCENLVWTWAYFRALSGLHTVAKTSPQSLDAYPQLVSSLYHALFDALFLKLHHFIDPSKHASGFPNLFKLLRRYDPADTNLLQRVKLDENRFSEEANLKKISVWRNEVVAHLTRSHLNSEFFTNNQLHLSEIEYLIVFLEDTLETYSQTLLQRFNDTRHPSAAVVGEVAALLTRGSTEESHGKCRSLE